jgi:Holliday junction resolvase-like predicted endonuclease
VKTRTSRDEFYTAEGQVDETKRKALRRLGSLYLRRLPTRPANKRIDVVAVYLLPGKPAEFEHFRSAIAWDAD